LVIIPALLSTGERIGYREALGFVIFSLGVLEERGYIYWYYIIVEQREREREESICEVESEKSEEREVNYYPFDVTEIEVYGRNEDTREFSFHL